MFCFGGDFLLDEKIKVARLSIMSNTILTAGKLAAGMAMGSMAVISEAIHSGVDLLASVIAFLSVRESGKPADDVHRFGHGKFENLAAIIEALLIVSAAGVIVWQAVPMLFAPGEVHVLGLGLAVMGVSAAVNFYVSARLFDVARRTDSPALEADGWHLRTDVYTSLGIFAGLIAIKLTGLTILDPIIALMVTVLILKSAYKLLRESIRNILDVRLSDEEEGIIRGIIHRHAGDFVNFHQLRTRKSGPYRYIDLHLVVPGRSTVFDAHDLCRRIEQSLKESIPGVEIIIKTEPCNPANGDCNRCTLHIKLSGRLNPPSAGQCVDCVQCRRQEGE